MSCHAKPYRRIPLVLAAGLAATAAADDETRPEGEPELPSARAVIDKNLEETGHVEACHTTTSLHTRARLEVVELGLAGTVDTYSRKPDLLLTEVDLEGFGKTLSGHDGDVAWSVHPLLGARVLEGAERRQLLAQADYLAPLKASERYERMEVVGKTTFDERECFEVRLVEKAAPGVEEDEALRTTVDYYDVETGLLAGSLNRRAGPQGTFAFTTKTRDYRKVGERLIPHQQVQEMPGQTVKISIEVFEYDVVEPEVFALPDEVRAKLR